MDGFTEPNRTVCLVLALLLTWFSLVSGYSSGPPSSVCNSMIPGHSASPATSPSPYTVTLSQNTYTPGQQITVTIMSPSARTFKGFFIQPRPGRDVYTTYGSFDTPSGSRNPCGIQGPTRSTTLTHSSSLVKSSITITWTAPDENVGDVYFVYTVLENYSNYWVKQVSEAVRFQAPPTNPPTQPPTTSQPQTTQPPTTTQRQTTQRQTTQPPATTQQQTTQPPVTTQRQTTQRQTTQPQTTQRQTTQPQTTQSQTQRTINRDAACGVTKGCFPADCSTNCDYLVTYQDRGSDLEFTLMKKTQSSDYYISIGFSSDPKMGEDSVADCISNQGVVDIGSSYNQAYKYNEAFSQSNYGLTLLEGSYTNGILRCTFLRKKNAALVTAGVGGRKKRAVEGGPSTFFDLESDWYLFVAHGTAFNGMKQKHSVFPAISSAPIDFQTVTETPVTTPGPTGGIITKDPGCGETVGCFHDCEGDSCDFLLTWNDNGGDDVDITLSCRRAGNVYCAIGLSKDEKMGDDSIFECVSSGSQVQAYVSYNRKTGRDNSRLSDDQYGLTFTSGSHDDGILRCEFSRKKTAALALSASGRRKRTVVPDASTFFDMNSDWHLLYAYGTSIGGYLNKHTAAPIVSSSKADFQSFQDIGAKKIKKDLMKAHAIMMVVAWMLNATLGIYMARFYKQVWPEGMEWCGDKRWFVIHRALMISVSITTIVAVVLIFVHVEGWAEISGSNFEKSHPIIGLVVTGFAVINPIMAFFRPHPGTKYRPAFKGFHTLVGVAAYVMATVNIFSGTLLSAAHVPDYVRIILYVYCGWTFLMDMVLHIYGCYKPSGKKEEAYELKPQASGDDLSSAGTEGVDSVKVAILALHALVVIGLCVAVCIIIGTAEHH